MRIPVPYPAESPVYSLSEPSRGARRGLTFIGDRGTPATDGWTREERAVEAGGTFFLGERLEFGSDDPDALDGVLHDLIIGRLNAVMLHGGGVVVPSWSKLDELTRDLLLTATRSWPVAAGDRIALVTPPAAPLARRSLYRLDGTTSARLIEVERLSGKYSQDALLERLDTRAPAWAALNAEAAKIMQEPDHVRDFEAARTAARHFEAEGQNGVWIARYLSTFGYLNSKGVPGSWHHARLTEVLDGVGR